MARHRLRRRRRSASAAVVLLVAGGATAVLAQPQVGAAVEVAPAPATGVWTVDGHGNGHGHGLSQYGARGAARRGLSAAQIIAFYYPHTTLATKSGTTIRVQIADNGGYTTVAPKAGLTVTGVAGALPTAGISRYRLVPSGAGLALQRLAGGAWATVHAGLPARADFAAGGLVRVFHGDGSFTDYRGTVGAVRNGAGELTVNRLGLDAYTQGVVPRESPSSWESAAVQAQAIAARSYARYAVEHNAGSPYDICDTTNCQVYGGAARYSSSGTRQYGEEPGSNAAVAATTNQVATYGGATIFAQFSAADGGWTTDGGQPYLVAHADPYEQYSDSPYFAWSRTVPVASVATYYGLSRLTAVRILARDGHGDWGGRVTSAAVDGVNSRGVAVSVSTTGSSLAAAMDLPHPWFHVRVAVPSAPTAVSATASDGGASVRWGAPASVGTAPITGYSLTVAGGPRIVVPATARAAWMGSLANSSTYTISVRAISSAGQGPAATVSAKPVAAPQDIRLVTPVRMFDTRPSRLVVSPTAPLRFGVPGHGGVPTTATAVQIALTIVNPSSSGTLSVTSDLVAPSGRSTISYLAGITMTSTVTVPLVSSRFLLIRPSSGTVSLVADIMSYSLPSAARVAALPPSQLLTHAVVGTGLGTAVPVRGRAGVPANATGVLLQVTGRIPAGAAWVRVFQDGIAPPLVSQLTAPAGQAGTSTVVVPIGSSGAIRVAAMNDAVAVDLAVVGYVGPAAAGLGRLESIAPSPIADSAGGTPSLHVGPGTTVLRVLDQPSVPTTGVQAVLVQTTVSGASQAGTLRLFPNGGAAPVGASSAIVPGRSIGATMLVKPGRGGAILLQTDGATATVAVDVIGYATS